MTQKPIAIIKTGYTHHSLSTEMGDFDDWTFKVMDILAERVMFIDAFNSDPLPDPEMISGAVITGAHSMVTDREPWSLILEKWVEKCHKKQTPLLGICYGHQLICQSLNGQVDNHAKGKELGTVLIHLTPNSKNDPLFKGLPESFYVHTSHEQSLISRPTDSCVLAYNEHEENHVIRIGQNTWGLQFHPEFNVKIMREYIQRDSNFSRFEHVDIIEKIKETPIASTVLQRFAKYCLLKK